MLDRQEVGASVSMTTAGRHVGARVARVEDLRLLTGHGEFVDDIVRPGLLHACFVRSPFARARILGIDARPALALPGVHAVLTGADLNPAVQELWYTIIGPNVPDNPRPPLADGEVRFVGDPVALVLADDRYVAEDAVELVDVEYEQLTPVVDYRTATGSEERVFEQYEHNVLGSLGPYNAERAADAFASAPHVVEETFYQQGYAAVPMETRGIVVEWSASSGEMTIWSATQSPHEVRQVCSRVLGVPEQQIRVLMRDTGGGFGQKVVPGREEIAMMLAARAFPAPLKWVEDRRENLMAGGMARREHGTARMAFDEQGLLLAASIDHVQDVGAYPTPWPVGTAAAVGAIFPGPYRIPVTNWTTTSVLSNTMGRGAYRGPWQFESVAREMLLDVGARRLGLDPVELRRRNILAKDELPWPNGNGMVLDAVSPRECLELALEMLDYDGFRREQEVARAQGRYLGVGTCSYVEPTTSGGGVQGSEGAILRIDTTGKVSVYVAGGSAGNSIETTVLQLTADALGVDMADVCTIQNDTAVTPFGAGTQGSRSGSMTAGAVRESAAVLRRKIAALAGHLLEASPDDIELGGGQAFVRGNPTSGVSLAKLARLAYLQPEKLPPGMEPGLEASARYRAESPIVWANASHVCTCEVDLRTGHVQLLRYVVAEDCGPMINPNVVEGQIAGGTVQGIGGALLEELVYDEDGNPLATTFVDYLLPTSTEVPLIEHGHVETPGPGPGGFKGVGEGGAIGAAPAVLNAVADALSPFGISLTELPASPSRLIALIERAPTR